MKLTANKYNIDEIIYIIREWTELSQDEFGKCIGKNQTAISRIEHNTMDITFKEVLFLCEQHKINIIFEKKN